MIMAKINSYFSLENKCNRCNYWTKDNNHSNFKCHCGDCPAKIRDSKKSKIELLKKTTALSRPRGYDG